MGEDEADVVAEQVDPAERVESEGETGDEERQQGKVKRKR